MIDRQKLLGLLILVVFLFALTGPVYAVEDEDYIPVTGVNLDYTEKTLELGRKTELNATVYPFNASDRRVWWYSSDPDVVEVLGGGWNVEISARSQGEARVSVVTVCGGEVKSCLVEVFVPVRSVSIEQDDLSLAPGESVELKARVLPENADEQKVTWESSRSGVASVDQSGEVEASDAGETRIIARSVENERINSYITLTVEEAVPAVVDEETAIDDPEPPDEAVTLLARIGPLGFILAGLGAVVIVAGAVFLTSRRRRKDEAQMVFAGAGLEKAQSNAFLVGLSGRYAGEQLAFAADQITIGRDPAVAQVVYPEEMSEISRQHCTLYYERAQNRVVLEDTSFNGTYLSDGKKLGQNQRYYLQPGETFSLTKTGETFTVKLG